MPDESSCESTPQSDGRKFFPLFYKSSLSTARDDNALPSQPAVKTRGKSKKAPASRNTQVVRVTRKSGVESSMPSPSAPSEHKPRPSRTKMPPHAKSPSPTYVVGDSSPSTTGPNAASTVVTDSDDPTRIEHSLHIANDQDGLTACRPSQCTVVVADPPLGTRNTPIEVLDSPEMPKHSLPHVHTPSRARNIHRPKGDQLVAPWPTSKLQHNRGSQYTLQSLQLPTTSFHSRIPLSSFPTEPDDDFFLACNTSTDDFELPHNLPLIEQEDDPPPPSDSSPPRPIHPAFHRDLTSFDSSSGQTWADFYRPTSADHVLGNEQHARYLRTWLVALRLQLDSEDRLSQPSRIRPKLKRPAVIRAVNPRRKRRRASEDSDADDWLVDDDNDDDDEPGRVNWGSDEEYEPAPVLQSNHSDSISSVAFSQLTNVIVLTGPPGVGKSAAAHACAAELGWSVFEIHPGIGKRNGSNIMSLVGDAARNHHLRLGNFADVNHSQNAQTQSSLESPTSGFPDQAADVHTVRQSMFLFDEVDILFRDDTNFWPTVVELVAGSRRPVILTCNDISFIPLRDLPIQAILEFRPPEEEMACSYLQQLGALNGLHLDRRLALAFYNHEHSTRQEHPRGDLRQSINSLQFWASAASLRDSRTLDIDELVSRWDDKPGSHFRASPTSQGYVATDDLRSLWRLVECVSSSQYSHSRLCDFFEPADQPQQQDDVAGQTELPINDTLDRLSGSGFLDRVQSLKAAALRASRREYETTGAGHRARGTVQPSSARMDAQTFAAGQRWHQSQQAALVHDVVPTCMLRPSSREIVLDYLPRILEMVHADNKFEQDRAPAPEEAGTGAGGRRLTRRRRQMQYERYVTLSEEAAVAARNVSTWAEP